VLRFFIVFLLFVAGCAWQARDARRGSLSPEEALRSFKLHRDFQIEIFATEPHVRDPVELVFDERGRMFVVEMLDYPDDPPKGQPPRGRIRMIEDTNRDGRIDKSTIFAEQLLQAASILPWRGGLLAGVAPDIVFLRDTNGDGRADERRALMTGFAVGNSEHRITSLRYGIDNWVYAANDGQPGTIRSPEWPDAPPVSVHGADFRFRPDRRSFEATAQVSQYGLTFDDYGNRFGTQNTTHVRHVVLPRHYVARNPYLPARPLVQDTNRHGMDLFQLTAPQGWRVARSAWRQRRFDEQGLKRTEIVSGTITGASGGTIYNADLFPSAFRGNLFTGDVAGNLVHRDVLVPDGLTFRAERAAEERDREFLASTDPWFRPCNFTVGPDGSLYVIDIHREFIETPESIPVPIRKSMDFYSGTEQGRIYRITPRLAARPSTHSGRPEPVEGRRSPLVTARLDAANPDALAATLEHPNQWWRLTAQRLLVEKHYAAAAAPVRRMARSSAMPVARIHALWTLEGLDALRAEDVDVALRDGDPSVREHALRLAEHFPALGAAVKRLAADEALRVRFQTLLTLGGFEGAAYLPTIARIVAGHADNEWFRRAVLGSRWGSSASLVDALIADEQYFKEATGARATLLRDLGAAIAASADARELRRFLTRMAGTGPLADPIWQSAAKAGVAEGLKIAGIRRTDPAEMKDAARRAFDRTLPDAQREAAIVALGQSGDRAAADQIIGRWSTLTAALRARAAAVLAGHPSSATALLDAIDRKAIDPKTLEATVRETLTTHPDTTVRARAVRVVPPHSTPPAAATRRAALTLAGDARRGEPVFKRLCASCHLRGGGRLVGPDLVGVSNRTAEELLESILAPSAAIVPDYVRYIAVLKDGEVRDGLIAGEAPGTITLRSPQGDRTILRTRIAELRRSNVSMMPDGLGAGMSDQELADLIAFLQAAHLQVSR
jgi:putative membrane-bound dehydrogenase-like protein